MGYHVITINTKKQIIEQAYIKSLFELIRLNNITEDSLIFQGEEHWKPVKISDNEQYLNYTKDWFIAGIRAQEKFKKQAKSKGLILEEINQDRESFSQYFVENDSKEIKRGDFLIRNKGNIEVDVKCRTFYEEGDVTVFKFKCADVEKHLNMQELTNSPVLIAVYERDGEYIKDDIPFFISIDEINSNKTSLEIVNVKEENTGECYQIPLTLTSQTFKYIEEFNGQKTKSKSYALKKKRAVNKNTYKKWTPDDDERLEKLYCKKKSIKKLSEIFGRNIGAINSRIAKLELKQKYDLF